MVGARCVAGPTVLWHRRYVGADDHRLRALAAARKYDLYLLTGDEIPFVQDGLRDGEHVRHQMHTWFVQALQAQATPWLLLAGSPNQRLAAAAAAVEPLLQPPRRFPR
jgi:nicotinamide riboside kinase